MTNEVNCSRTSMLMLQIGNGDFLTLLVSDVLLGEALSEADTRGYNPSFRKSMATGCCRVEVGSDQPNRIGSTYL